MTSGFHRRVSSLERKRRRCQECGAGRSPTEYAVVWDDSENQEPGEPEYCETCGRQIVYIVTWNDIEPDSGSEDAGSVPGEGGR